MNISQVNQQSDLKREWQPVKVTIYVGDEDIDAIGVFDAYTRGDRWNGFITAYFTKEEGQRVAAWAEAMHRKYPPDSVETVRWDEGLSAFVLESPEYPHEAGEAIPDEDIVPAVPGGALGVDLYPIGAFRWTWEEA